MLLLCAISEGVRARRSKKEKSKNQEHLPKKKKKREEKRKEKKKPDIKQKMFNFSEHVMPRKALVLLQEYNALFHLDKTINARPGLQAIFVAYRSVNCPIVVFADWSRLTRRTRRE